MQDAKAMIKYIMDNSSADISLASNIVDGLKDDAGIEYIAEVINKQRKVIFETAACALPLAQNERQGQKMLATFTGQLWNIQKLASNYFRSGAASNKQALQHEKQSLYSAPLID